ncbi:hypothetical protein AB0P17_05540 [Streptomyces sp. NPDC088124]|uniref:hypothetical protein n=1 Tax=unclassified Streptomyces TaxID=2593676 RepID=UPI0034194CBF
MSGTSRKEAEIRRLLDLPRPAVPAGLVARAARRGERMLRRRRAARRVVWAVLLAAVIVFTVWAWDVHPWAPPPARTTPPLEGW